MLGRSSHLNLSPFSRPFAIADYTSALSLCCAYARDAAAEGRILAAHTLFQSALNYFERAQQMVRSSDECSFHPWDFLGDAESVLTTARAQLDECARQIYRSETAPLDSAEIERSLK